MGKQRRGQPRAKRADVSGVSEGAASVQKTSREVLLEMVARGADVTENWIWEREKELAALLRGMRGCLASPGSLSKLDDAWPVAAGCMLTYQHTLRRLGLRGDAPLGRILEPADVRDTAAELDENTPEGLHKLPCLGAFARTMAHGLRPKDGVAAAEFGGVDAAILRRTRRVF